MLLTYKSIHPIDSMNSNYLLISKITRSYFVMGLILYPIILFYWLDSINYYNLLNVASWLTYAYLLWSCVNKDESYFTPRRLTLTVLVYTSIFVMLYLQMSFYYTGNIFLFSELDARVYYAFASTMKDMGFVDAFNYVSQEWRYDDWGAPMTMAFLMKIVPYKAFVNFVYIMMNCVCTLCLFDIGHKIGMTRKYSYMGALTYGIASYGIFFMGSFLKEDILLFLVIISFFLLYQYKSKQNLLYLAGGGFSSLLIIFFRVPIALFVWVAYATLLLFDGRSHVKKALFFFLFFVVGIMGAGLVLYSSSRYANSGNVTQSYSYVTTTLFQKLTSTAGALIGPFPALFQITAVRFTPKPLYGVGLLFKFLLFFPFWKGLVYTIKGKVIDAYPLYVFTILEMIGLCLVVDGLELRKAMPHVPLFILAAFWYMDRFDRDTDEGIRATPYYYWTYMGMRISIIVVFVLTLVWNILLRISGVEHFIMYHNW